MADFVYEVAVTGERSREAAVRSWFEANAAPAWTTLPRLSAVDAYVMVRDGTHDPFVDDGPGPLMLAMLQFPSAADMERAVASPDFAQSCAGIPADVRVTGSPFERRLYPVGDESTPAPLTAPFSYVVRYHRPAEDEAAFISYYLADHPPALAKLPAIRSVLCYLPIRIPNNPFPDADYMLGNEVAFDSPEAFNAAMASPVRHELRASYHHFPKFSGRNTHYPMMRRRLA